MPLRDSRVLSAGESSDAGDASDERVGYSQSCPDQRPHLAEISLIRHQNIVFQGNDDILVRPELEVVRDHTRSVLLFQSLESEWR